MTLAINTLVDLEGVYLTDANLFVKDCSFPITRLERACPPDAWVQNIPVMIGEWADDTAVPVLTDQEFNIDTTGVTDENCDTAVVTVDLDGCEFIAPNQVTMDIKTNSLPWKDLREKVCRKRGIAESQLGIPWDEAGNFLPNNPYMPDLVAIIMAVLGQVLIKEIAYSAAIGDVANPRQFDGFFTQLLGWDVPVSNPCASTINVRQTINWQTLTGLAQPGVDDVTIPGQTVNFWGTVFDVPAGLNLAQFLEDLWIPAVNNTWANIAGGVTVWEMLLRTGTERCILNAAACMQPCGLEGSNIIDPDLRARLAQYRSSLVGTFYPSGTVFSVKPSVYVESNVLWFGPRQIGGKETYALIWRNIESLLNELSPIVDSLYATASGFDALANPLLSNEMLDFPDLPFEDSVIHWDMNKVSAKCVEALIMAELGMLVTARHLWLEVTNVYCDTFVQPCDSGITIDGEPLPMPGVAT